MKIAEQRGFIIPRSVWAQALVELVGRAGLAYARIDPQCTDEGDALVWNSSYPNSDATNPWDRRVSPEDVLALVLEQQGYSGTVVAAVIAGTEEPPRNGFIILGTIAAEE